MDVVIQVLTNLHFELTTFCCQVVLFFCLHWFLSYTVYGPLIRNRNQRDLELGAGAMRGGPGSPLAQAEAMTANARRLKAEYEEQLRTLRRELQTQLQETTQAAERGRADLVGKAREEASQLMETAERQLEADRRAASSGLETQAKNLGRQMATRIIENTLTSPARDKALGRLGGA